MTDRNYKELVDIYSRLAGRGLEILAFPCNQFGKQEPGTSDEIKEFASRYGATFPIFERIDVNGPTAHPVYKYLRAHLPGTLGSSLKWNFTKFLVARDGSLVKRYAPPTNPLAIEPDIVAELDKPVPTEFAGDSTGAGAGAGATGSA